MKFIITGGCGYTGTILTNELLQKGFKVKVVDNQWFGNHLKKHPNLKTSTDFRFCACVCIFHQCWCTSCHFLSLASEKSFVPKIGFPADILMDIS